MSTNGWICFVVNNGVGCSPHFFIPLYHPLIVNLYCLHFWRQPAIIFVNETSPIIRWLKMEEKCNLLTTSHPRFQKLFSFPWFLFGNKLFILLCFRISFLHIIPQIFLGKLQYTQNDWGNWLCKVVRHFCDNIGMWNDMLWYRICINSQCL